MAVNIGDLIATLRADVSGLNGITGATAQFEKFTGAARTAGPALDVAGKAASELGINVGYLDQVMAAVLSPAGAFVATLGALATGAGLAAKAVMDNALEVRQLMAVSGLAAEDADNLADAFQLMGIESGTLTTAMFRMSTELETGGKGLDKLGISLTNSAGALKTEGELFLEAMTKIQGLGTASERSAALTDLFSRAGRELAGVAAMNTEQFQALQEKAKKYSDWSEEAQQQGFALKIAQMELGLAVDGVAQAIGVQLVPGIAAAVSAIGDWIVDTREMMQSSETLNGIWTALGAVTSSLGDVFWNVVDVLKTFTPLLEVAGTIASGFFQLLGASIAAVLVPLQGVLAGVAALLAGDFAGAYDKATAAMAKQIDKLSTIVDAYDGAGSAAEISSTRQTDAETRTTRETEAQIAARKKLFEQETAARLTALDIAKASQALYNTAIVASDEQLFATEMGLLDQRMAVLTAAYEQELSQIKGTNAAAIQERTAVEQKYTASFAAVTTAKLAAVDKMVAADQKQTAAELALLGELEQKTVESIGYRNRLLVDFAVQSATLAGNDAAAWEAAEVAKTLALEEEILKRVPANEGALDLVAQAWELHYKKVKDYLDKQANAWQAMVNESATKEADAVVDQVKFITAEREKLARDLEDLTRTSLQKQLDAVDREAQQEIAIIYEKLGETKEAAELGVLALANAEAQKLTIVQQSEDATLDAITKTVNDIIKMGETQVETVEKQYADQVAIVKAAMANEYGSQEIYYKALTRLEEDHFLALQQARQQDLARSLAVTAAQAQAAGDYFGFFLTSLQQTAQAAGSTYAGLAGIAAAAFNSMAGSFSDFFVSAFKGDLDGMTDAFEQFANDLLRIMSEFLATEVVKQFVGFASDMAGDFGRSFFDSAGEGAAEGAAGEGAGKAAAGIARRRWGGGKSWSETLFGSYDEYTGGTSGYLGEYGEMDWRGYAASAGILAAIGGAIYSLFKPTPTRDTTTGLNYPGIAVGPEGAVFQPFALTGTGGDVPMGEQATAQFAAALEQSGQLYTALFNTFPQEVLEQISGSIASANAYVQGALDEQASHGGNPVKELMEKLPDAFGDAYIGVLSDAVTLTAQGLQQELPGFYALVDDSVAGIQAQFNALIAEAQAGIEGPEFNARVAQLVAQFGSLQKLFEQAAGFVATSSEILGNLSLDTAALLETLATDAPQDAFGQFTQQLAAIDAALAAEADKVEAGVIPDLQRMTDLVVQRYTTELAFLAQIQAVSEGIAQSIEAQIAGIQFNALSEQEQAGFLLDQASTLYQQLAGAQTIEEVTALTGQIQSTVDSLLQMGDTLITAFGYTPQSLEAMAVDLLRATEDLATSKLTDFQDAARATEDEFAAMLADVASSFGTTLDLTDAQVAGLGDQAAASAAALADLANVIGAMTTAGLEIAGVLNPAATAAAAGLSGPAFNVVGESGESASFEGASGASGVPGIPQFHSGGYVERDTLAELAAGEVVWDAATVRAARSSQRSGRDVNLTVTVPLDGEVLARAVVTRINRRTRAGQRTFASDTSYGRNRS